MKIRNTYFLARNLQKISSVFILLIAICLISLLSQTHAQAKLEKTFSKNQTEQIFTLIERYIDNNPEIVLRALEKIQSKEKEELETEQKNKLVKIKNFCFPAQTA